VASVLSGSSFARAIVCTYVCVFAFVASAVTGAVKRRFYCPDRSRLSTAYAVVVTSSSGLQVTVSSSVVLNRAHEGRIAANTIIE